MTLMIGRAGQDVTLNDPSSWRLDGADRVSAEGWIRPGSVADLQAQRQQLLGMVNNVDEPIMPVTCTTDTSINGFYRLVGADVDVPAGAFGYKAVKWTAQLERLPNYGNAVFESYLVGALRVNGHSITATNMVAFISQPLAVEAAQYMAASWSTTARSGAEGNDQFYTWANPTLPATAGFSLQPAAPSVAGGFKAWYQSAVKLYTKAYDNSNYRIVAGRQVPFRRDIYNPGQDWRISNGYIRITPNTTTGSDTGSADLDIEHYDGSQWDTAKRYTFTINSTALTSSYPYSTLTVLRNDPVCVSIRLTMLYNGATLDLTVRRGSRFVEGRFATPANAFGDYVIARQSTEASTALTGGIRATSNDASGNRFVIATPVTHTTDLVNGKITKSSVSSLDFMIGSEIGGSGASGQDTAQNQVYQYMCAQSEAYRAVVR